MEPKTPPRAAIAVRPELPSRPGRVPQAQARAWPPRSPSDALAGLAPTALARRRALTAGAVLLAGTALPACQLVTGKAATSKPVEAPATVAPTFGFQSGAQLFVLARGPVTFHCYVAPESGVGASAYLIEFKDQLFVYDTQLTPALGRELRYYGNTLNKRFTRVIISHEHAEQWSGWSEFADLPTYAPRETEAVLAYSAPKLPPRVGVEIPRLAGVIAAGDETVAGVRAQFRLLRDAEAASIVTIGFADQTVYLAGDVIYNRLHPFLGNNTVARWLAALDEIPAWATANTCTLLPGHGAPTNGSVVAEMRRYLQAAQTAFTTFKSADEIEKALRTQFPDYGGTYLLRFGIDTALQR